MRNILTTWRQMGFVAEEAVASITRSGWMSGIVVITMTVSLLVLGGIWQISNDLYALSRAVGGKVEVMAFVASNGDTAALASTIRQIPGVETTEIITKERAWQKFQHEMGDAVNFENLIADNPLPDTIRVKVIDPDQVEAVAAKVKALSGIEDINYGHDLLIKLQQITSFIQTAGFLVVGALMVATLAVTGNTIRLTVQARRREIEIMQLVGASAGFIHWPFLLEGMIFGLLGTLLAMAGLLPWHRFVSERL
ncbi:MAG: ABC transporter permease, partial [Cyanobacteria bacterium REEB65]|nr:ABC transporter permease [Cyanobacteria bacterium REEB65]